MSLSSLTLNSLNSQNDLCGLKEALGRRGNQLIQNHKQMHFSGGLFSLVAASTLSQTKKLEFKHLRLKTCLWMETRRAREFAKNNNLQFSEIEVEDFNVSPADNFSDLHNSWEKQRKLFLSEGFSAGGIPIVVQNSEGNLFIWLSGETIKDISFAPDSLFFWERSLLKKIFFHPCFGHFLSFTNDFFAPNTRYWYYILFRHELSMDLPDYGFYGFENLWLKNVYSGDYQNRVESLNPSGVLDKLSEGGLLVPIEEWLRFLS